MAPPAPKARRALPEGASSGVAIATTASMYGAPGGPARALLAAADRAQAVAGVDRASFVVVAVPAEHVDRAQAIIMAALEVRP